MDAKDSDARLGIPMNATTNDVNSGNDKNWNFGGVGILRHWVGTLSSNWNNAQNWDTSIPCKPQDSDDMPTGTPNMPVLAGTGHISTLTVESGASRSHVGNALTISSFTVGGNFILVGTETISRPPVILVGSSVTYISNGASLILSSWTYRNLVINGSGGVFVVSGGSVTVNENLTLTAGTLDDSANFAIGVSSNWVNNGGVFTAGLSTVTFNAATAGHTIQSNGSAFGNVFFNGSGAVWTLQDALTVNSTMTLNAGTLNTGSSQSVAIGSNWTNNGGAFIANQSTISFIGNAAQIFKEPTTTFNVFIDSNNAGTVTFPSSFTANAFYMNAAGVGPENVFFTAGSTYTITALTMTGASGKGITFRSTQTNHLWYLNNTGTSFGSYVNAKDSNAQLGNLINASTNGTDAGNNTNWNLGGAGVLKTWQGNPIIGSNTNWMNGENWDTGIPAPQDSALIPLVSHLPTLSAAVSLSTLTINAGSMVTLAGNGVSLSSFTNAGIVALLGIENVTSAPNNLAGSTVTYIATSGSSLVFSSWTYSNLIINGTGGTFNNPAQRGRSASIRRCWSRRERLIRIRCPSR